jgi:small subunit ribosomal protein S18
VSEGGRDFGRDREGGRDFGRDREGGRDFGRDRDRDGGNDVRSRLRAKHRKKQRKRRGGSFLRRRVCRFCADSKLAIDYKDSRNLRFCISETGKMVPSRISGNCARHQRQVTRAIKRARHLALMPFIEVGG